MGFARRDLHAPPSVNMFSDEKATMALYRFGVQFLNHDVDLLNQEHFLIEGSNTFEKVEESVSFPGVLTSYTIYRFKVAIRDPYHPGMACVGLPACDTFETSFESTMEEAVKNVFIWVLRPQFEDAICQWFGTAQPVVIEEVPADIEMEKAQPVDVELEEAQPTDIKEVQSHVQCGRARTRAAAAAAALARACVCMCS